MKTTILKELSRELPELENCCRDTHNSFNNNWDDFSSWKEWKEFNAPALHNLLGRLVDAAWDMPSNSTCILLEQDKTFYDEEMLEHQVISKRIMPLVNAALDHACRVADIGYKIWIGRSGGSNFIGSGYKPD